ncbi:MAG: STAS domain-containing protein [Spirochaetes bacterium]|nr:STAS domain-containing protein [Spirochaetota bacterium]
MRISKRDDNTIIIFIEHDIMGDTLGELGTKLKEMSQQNQKIIIDLKKVKYAVSSFVTFMEESFEEFGQKKIKLVLRNCNDRIKDLFGVLTKQEIEFE